MPTKQTDCILKPMEQLSAFRELLQHTQHPGTIFVSGVDDSQKLHQLAALVRATDRTVLLVTANELAAMHAVEDLNQMIGGAVLFPARDVCFLRAAASSRELSQRRLEALGVLMTGGARVLVAPIDALLQRLMPREMYLDSVIRVEEAQQCEPKELLQRLIEAGYERVDVTEARGQCALRGGILDVYPVGQPNALRIEFFDDEIDSLRDFDIMTQRSTNRRKDAVIYPASEVLLGGGLAQLAAQRLENAVAEAGGRLKEQPEEKDDTQKELEKEFDLMPIEDFVSLIEDDELPGLWDMEKEPTPKKPKKQPAKKDIKSSPYAKQFSQRLDKLRHGIAFDGADSMMNILYETTCTIADYLDNPVIALDQPDRLRERCDNRRLEFEELFKASLERFEALPEQGEMLLTYDYLLSRFDAMPVMCITAFQRTLPDFKPTALVKYDALPMTGYQGNLKELARDIKSHLQEGWRIALLAGGTARGQRLKKALDELSCATRLYEDAEQLPEELDESCPIILPKGIAKGFSYSEIKLAVIAESDVYGLSRKKNAAKASTGDKMTAFTDLKVGDYVVHESHGIGRFMGTVRLSSEGTYRDFLHIQYQGSDKLYVPADQMDRIQKYIGSEGEPPKLNKLSGGEWQKQKARVKASIQEIAGDLVKLYASRTAGKGYAFSPDTQWQRQFEDAFEYEETPDQLAAIEDIKRDMEKPQIMDRLLCGDVGYGKTEVALRAIFKCIMDGKQAALLAPTTILVQQHYATMLKRLHGFPAKVETLSRFSTAAQQKAVIQKLKQGEIDIVIGTHRLLGKDVVFKDLGLLVVDEEQRFGVKHKESIKQLRQNVDVLTLSATPIPRTLHMSMVGIRDMSLLRTPPEERYPVQTYVVEYSDGLIRDAILREISRGGQVYVLYNRVQSIEMMYARLKKLVPEAKIAIGHGQMKEHALEDVMLDFYEGKYDVLLCTTIIEAGLDVPRANTLIVCDSDRFGLSQLYQLRGRVGRSNRLAYAFLTVTPGKILTDDADKRLAAIREFTEFGSGFRVAMRDLEIRGAGNLLGSEQSGHMVSVGYDLYVKMIDEAVRNLRGDVEKGDIQTKMELHINAYLPSEYVTNDITRMEIYKKIASVSDQSGREDLIEELIDRFGDPTKSVMNLIDIAHLKNLCQKLGIDNVTFRNPLLVMRFAPNADTDPERLLEAIKGHEKHLKLTGGREVCLNYFDARKSPEELLSGSVKLMEKVVAAYESSATPEQE